MTIFATIIGILTVAFSFLAKVVGQPSQMIKNYKRKSTEGLSTLMFVIAFLSYFFYTLHGILTGDWVVIAGQSLGVVTSGILLGQIVYYRKRNSDTSK